MANSAKIGVLLMDKASGSQIGFIEFDPSGMLVYQIIKSGLHVYALKPIGNLLDTEWFKEPLYKKHAQALDKDAKLPDEILVREAAACTEFLNSRTSPLKVGEYEVRAQIVNVKT